MNSLTRKNWAIPSINTITLKMNMEMKELPMKNGKDLQMLIQIGKPDFLTLTRELGLLILIMVGKEGTQILISIG